MIQPIYRIFIELTNRKRISYLIATFTKSQRSKFLIPSFSRVYHIDQTEMEKSLEEYQTLHEFFTRKLKNDARKVDPTPLAVISPVDAEIQDIGTISSDFSFTVKGKQYTISEMLGSPERAKKYLNGNYMIFYLSPSNYHRIHSPVSGKVMNRWEIGSESYPLNGFGLKYGKRPLSKNFRIITEINCQDVSIAMVKIGAMFINSIELLNTGTDLVKGDEIAYFSFGSSVVLLFESGKFHPALTNHSNSHVKVGDCIGYLNK